MTSFILSANVDMFSGALSGSIPFGKGLNLLSGENGTGKTRILQAIKSGQVTTDDSSSARMLAFSPKRNSERRTFDAIVNQIRSQNAWLPQYLTTRAGAALQDNNFDTYKSFAEIHFMAFESESRDGSDRRAKMANVTHQFNTIIGKIFDNYELFSEWNSELGAPDISLKKHDREIPLQALSCGEQE